MSFSLLPTGRLAPEELKSCLVSVGYSIGKDRQGELDFQRILAVVDPNNTGKSFSMYIVHKSPIFSTWIWHSRLEAYYVASKNSACSLAGAIEVVFSDVIHFIVVWSVIFVSLFCLVTKSSAESGAYTHREEEQLCLCGPFV